MVRGLGLAGVLLIAASGMPALAQAAAYGPPPPPPSEQEVSAGVLVSTGSATSGRQGCRRSADSQEIVVCIDRGEDQRIPSTAESDPTSHEALYDGVPRAPQLDRGSCKGQPGCMIGGWAPPPVYYIDVKALPQAPKGSDADLIAKGEKAED